MMTFNQWWATLTDKEQKLLGQHNARFVWGAAATAEREACAKVCDDMEEKAEGTECCKWPTPIDCAHAIRARNNND